jgi:hypothetical protein
VALPEFPHSSPDAIQRSTAQAGTEAEDGGVTGDTKYGKPEVDYRPAGSSNTRCERCSHFAWSTGSQGKGTCRLVAGLIDPSYVCNEFESGGSGLMDLVTGEPTY